MTVECRRVPLLDVDVYFINSITDAKAFIRSKATDPDEEKALDGCRGGCYVVKDSDGGNHRMMCVFTREDFLNTAAHEAVHMAWITLTHCCIKITEANHEVLAYLAAWLTEEMLRLFPLEAKP